MSDMNEKKLAIAAKIMRATEYLARIQAQDPHVNDRRGFGTAHYGLGLILAAMWSVASTTDEKLEIAPAAAFLLWKHRIQAAEQGVSEKMIGVFLPNISKWPVWRLEREQGRIREFCSGTLTWCIDDAHTRIDIVGIGDDPKMISMLGSAARHCNLQVATLFGNRTLIVPEERIGQLVAFAAKNTAFRGLLPVGGKMSFDTLSLEFPYRPDQQKPARLPTTPLSAREALNVPKLRHDGQLPAPRVAQFQGPGSSRTPGTTERRSFQEDSPASRPSPDSRAIAHAGEGVERAPWWRRLIQAITHL